jgi:hypothetical protein
MTNSIPKLKKGMKALVCTGQGKFFHLQSALLSGPIYPQHAEAFKVAADMILDSHQSAKWGPHRDTLLFPVLYLYRHCLELKLKDLVLLAVRIGFFDLAEEKPEFCALCKRPLPRQRRDVAGILEKHELCPLWTKAKRLILDSYPKDDEAHAAEAIINEFDRIDPDGQTLRYDRKKGTLELRRYKKLPSHIGVAHLRTKMDSVYHYLDNCHAGILDRWDAGQQAMD